jgi:hypothetical protein
LVFFPPTFETRQTRKSHDSTRKRLRLTAGAAQRCHESAHIETDLRAECQPDRNTTSDQPNVRVGQALDQNANGNLDHVGDQESHQVDTPRRVPCQHTARETHQRKAAHTPGAYCESAPSPAPSSRCPCAPARHAGGAVCALHDGHDVELVVGNTSAKPSAFMTRSCSSLSWPLDSCSLRE